MGHIGAVIEVLLLGYIASVVVAFVVAVRAAAERQNEPRRERKPL